MDSIRVNGLIGARKIEVGLVGLTWQHNLL
jgi:hypothetical protein